MQFHDEFARMAEPQQQLATNKPMGDALRVNAFRMGQTFDSRSDSPGCLAVTEVYCAWGKIVKYFFTSVSSLNLKSLSNVLSLNMRLALRQRG